MNRIPGTRGFQNRIVFTPLLRLRKMSSWQDLLLARNRSRTPPSTLTFGLIFEGAGTRLPPGDGSTKFRMNQPPNHPGVISSTGASGFPSSAAEIAGRYASFVMHRCSRHWPMLHDPGAGGQLSCSFVSPAASARAFWSLALSSNESRVTQFGATASRVPSIVDLDEL